jgi:Secretion system C-terminal sorting domain
MTKNRAMVFILSILIALGINSSVNAANYTVTNNNDSGAGSLRQAILDADAVGSDGILFQDVGTITITSSLTVTGDNLFMGNSNDTYKVIIDAHDASFSALVINGYNVVVRNLSIIRSRSASTVAGTGIEVLGDSCKITSCRIGTDWDNAASMNFSTGVYLHGFSGDPLQYAGVGYRFGSAGEGCVIVCSTGIFCMYTYRMRIQSNYIGLSSDGMTNMLNSTGIYMGPGNIQGWIGGSTWPQSRNILSGSSTGIEITSSASDSFGNTINSVWMNMLSDGSPSGSTYTESVVMTNGVHGNFIGQAPAGNTGNLIPGAYIAISGTAVNNSIRGNTLTAKGAGAEVIMLMTTANANWPAPVIISANPGLIQGTGLNPDTVDVYVSDRGVGEQGGALSYVGSSVVSGGLWSVAPSGMVGGEVITAISTSPSNNSSEYAVNVLIQPPTPTSTPTTTLTSTPTATPTQTATITLTTTTTTTKTITATISPTATITPTLTITRTRTPTATITVTATVTVTPDNPLLNVDLQGKTALPYPNPANTSMRFLMHFEEPAKVAIQIYNLNGERIATIENNFASGRGQYAEWNCAQIAPGVYLARIIVDGQLKETHKLAIVK